jgi:hypothetical protein
MRDTVADIHSCTFIPLSTGRPEPTELVKKAPTNNAYRNQMSSVSSQNASNYSGGGGAAGGSNDPNGMERLAGESDQEYIARQTRLREEAKARMAAKFGGSGGLGGVGSGGDYPVLCDLVNTHFSFFLLILYNSI